MDSETARILYNKIMDESQYVRGYRLGRSPALLLNPREADDEREARKEHADAAKFLHSMACALMRCARPKAKRK